MRILQISDLAPPHIGGIEKVVWRYSKLLKERGQDVTILTSKLRETPSRENFDGVDFIRVPRYILSFPNIYSRNFDIIHTHSYFSFFSLGLEKKFTEKIIIKHVHSVYGEELEEFTGWSFSRIFSKIERYLLTTDCSGFIVPSNFTKMRLIELGIKNEVFVLPHAPEYHDFPPKDLAREKIGIPKNSKVVGFIGRMSKGKGPQDIASIWSEIKKAIPEAILIFVGPEPDVKTSGIRGNSDIVRDILRKSKSLESVIFAGKVEEEMMPYYISSFDLYVSPSINEGFGMSILNSMYAGIPVVAYRNTAIPELVDDAGILVNTGDLEGLKNAIISILSDKVMRKELSVRARERASNYTWENTINSLMDIYSHYL
ncbi:MAG: glycosyltransferase family 4 protein [Thermoplasmata archaeon]